MLMRKIQLLIITLAICLPSLTMQIPVSASKHKRNPSAYAPGEVIVKLKQGIDSFTLADKERHNRALARSIGETNGRLRDEDIVPMAVRPNQDANRDANRDANLDRIDEIISRRGLDRTFVLHFDRNADIDSIIERLRADDRVEYATPNYRVTPGSLRPDDPAFIRQWALLNLGAFDNRITKAQADIKALEAWDITTGNPDLIVAISDSGVDIDHPDLAPNIYTNPKEIPGNGIDDDNNGYIDDVHGANVVTRDGDVRDVYGHGTFMAGIIAARMNNNVGISGVAQIKILPVNFFTTEDDGFPVATMADAARSLLYSIAAGASIINASWSSELYTAGEEAVPPEDAQALKDAVLATNDAGVLLVCIAGNKGYDNDKSLLYPGAYKLPNQIVVAATDYNDKIWADYFGNFLITGFGQTSVHLAAPGVSILTTSARGSCLLCSLSDDPDDWYALVDGTSASAAFVTGVAALVKSKYPEDLAPVIKSRILGGVDQLDTLYDREGHPYVATAGRLNAFGALMFQPAITPPVLTRVKYKKGSGKLLLYGEALQEGVVAVVGNIVYPIKPKSPDLSVVLARVPNDKFPVGVPVSITLRNPDGGISQIVTFTR